MSLGANRIGMEETISREDFKKEIIGSIRESRDKFKSELFGAP